MSQDQVFEKRPRTVIVFWLPLLLLFFCTFVAASFYSIDQTSTPGSRSLNISLYKVGSQDFVWLLVAVAVFVSGWIISSKTSFQLVAKPDWRLMVGMCAMVSAVIWSGTFLVYHDFALSMDEFMMLWQSDLIRQGLLLAPAPDAWWPYSHATRPGFLLVDDEYRYWASAYRPGTALIHALFAKLGIASLMNASLCVGSLIILWKLACRDLESAGSVFWAVLLLATAPQFLITAMAPYTMTAHLFASLLWIWLFTRDRKTSHVFAIAVGCYALGLHHVHVHSFLVLPFLLHLLFIQRRGLLFLAYAIPYTMAVAFWIYWMDIAIWLQGLEPVAARNDALIDGGMGYVNHALSVGIDRHSWADLMLWSTNLTRFIAWQNLAILPLFFLALRSFRDMPLTLRLLAWSILSSLVPYILLMPSQGHGWGYRYLHQTLGHFALMAGFGWSILMRHGLAKLARFVSALALASILLALPLRAYQTEAFVGPFAETMRYLKESSAKVVIVHTFDIWYGQDLVRNEPLIGNSPVILAMFRLNEEKLARLCARYDVTYEDGASLEASGMVLRASGEAERDKMRKENEKLLERAGCIQ